MTAVGDTLRTERLRRGLKPAEVAAVIKIAPYLIEAMENGRFDRLPGGAYRRSFLRQYAPILGVDEDEIVAAFRQQYDDPEVALPAPPAERRTRPWGLFWMVAAAVACAGAYKFLQEDLPAWPQRGVASVPVSQAGVMPASPAPVAPQMPQSGSASRPATDAVQPVRVAFTPQEPVWISVRCDGTESFRGILEGPATREFGAAKKMMILIGNAGGLTASWNGHPIGPIGARGEVQLLEVTAQGARVVPRKSAPPTAPDDGHGAS